MMGSSECHSLDYRQAGLTSVDNIPEKTRSILQKGFHIQILFRNQISGSIEPKATLSSGNLGKGPATGGHDVKVLDYTLVHLREQLGKKVDTKWSFCLENCAPVEDSSTLCYYVTLLDSNVKVLQEPPVKKDEVPSEAAALPLLSVYMAVGNAMAPAAKGFGAEWADKHQASLTLTDRSAEQFAAPAVPMNYKAEYIQEAD